ncbi:MAG: hypothetical protein GF401_05985 [Chitinivibrionales bacterium]|nr:hypothetical protein [Chitinivibrionales bacterium]
MNTPLSKMIALCIIVVLLALSLTQAFRLAESPQQQTSQQKTLAPVPGMTDQPLVEKALTTTALAEGFKYSGIHTSPFKSLEKGHIAPRKTGGGSKKNNYVRNKLTLKGVLFKKKPLAIIEDESGKSHICGIGDDVRQQKIIAINEEGIKLRDPLGLYEIPAQEE